VAGDTFRVRPSYQEDRRALADEVARILRPGGHILVASPNRHFPFDLFHRHDRQRRIPRPYNPRDPFLLSFRDYREFFVGQAGCRAAELLPIVNYWGFVNMGGTLRGRMLRALLRGWFRAVSAIPALRASALSPWLCVHVVR
jgi:SAM-dependent methyltransferase